jgi:hypothetical protein
MKTKGRKGEEREKKDIVLEFGGEGKKGHRRGISESRESRLDICSARKPSDDEVRLEGKRNKSQLLKGPESRGPFSTSTRPIHCRGFACIARSPLNRMRLGRLRFVTRPYIGPIVVADFFCASAFFLLGFPFSQRLSDFKSSIVLINQRHGLFTSPALLAEISLALHHRDVIFVPYDGL